MSKYDNPIPKAEGETVDDVLQYPIMEIPSRGLKKKVCERFGVRSKFSEQKGVVVAHYFPVYKNGKVSGFKKRDLLKPKKLSFSAVGDVDASCDFMGSQAVDETKKYKLIITEGEYDALAVWQALNERAEDSGWKNTEPNVVSMCFGAIASLDQIGKKEDYLNQFKEIIFVYDMDDDGKEGARKCAFIRPDIKIANLSRKDPCEVAELDGAYALTEQVLNASEYEPDDVITGWLPYEVLTQPLKKGIAIQGFPKLSHKLQGLRPGEATLILAPAGVGKTTLCRAFGMSLMQAQESVDWILLEENAQKAQQALIAMYNNVPIAKYRQNPAILSQAKILDAIEALGGSGCNYVDVENTFGGMDAERCIQRLKWDAVRGVNWPILDHATMVTYGSGQVQDIDLFAKDIAAITSSTQLHPIVVSHITRRNRPAPREKDGSIKYPYWEEVHKEDARGSGAWEQLFWNIIVLEREILNGEGDIGRVRARVEKNREWGWLGLADTWVMDEITGRLRTVEEDYYG